MKVCTLRDDAHSPAELMSTAEKKDEYSNTVLRIHVCTLIQFPSLVQQHGTLVMP
jgi:hypothetical protein|eukprot:COSAG01_NODE_127_length_24940_cov_140.519923_8_plen_55_part_00